MPNSSLQRKRWTLSPPKAPFEKAAEFFKRGDVWARVALCAVATSILWVVMAGWAPAFSYRVREAPLRDLHARTTFEFDDLQATDQEKQRTQRNLLCYYANDQQALVQLRQALVDDVFAIKEKPFEEIDDRATLNKFFLEPDGTVAESVPPLAVNPPAEEEDAEGKVDADAKAEVEADSPKEEAKPKDPLHENFDRFRVALENDAELTSLREAIDRAFYEIDKNGLLDSLAHEIGQGSLDEIDVYVGETSSARRVAVSSVRTAEVSGKLQSSLIAELKLKSDSISDPEFVANAVFRWLKPQLPITLTWNQEATQKRIEDTLRAIEPVKKTYQPGEPLEQFNAEVLERRGIKAGVPINEADLKLLRAEHAAQADSELWPDRLIRSLSFIGLFTAFFSMLSQYLYYRDRHLMDKLSSFALLLGLITLTLVMAWWLSLYPTWRAEVVPIVLFAMTIAIAYHVELALFASGLVCLAFCAAHGFGLAEFVILMAASSTSAFYCRKIRSRTRLVNVGLTAAAIVFPTVIGVQYMLGQPLHQALLTDAILFSAGTFAAGLLMTNLLPFLEGWFEIQTDARLLELSDANHPLLKELVQRAPGTYNHSINVASISEAAADSIGANGLLCRVAAYFHDVGKLRKPEYFIENQAGGINKHDDLTPSMSTLVIVAHVKDGIEIGRNHKLPPRIIDLIEQHHGTTMVEYFYRRAIKNSKDENDGVATGVDEADFRYPGPRPQTREAAVMMLADAVESASRTLREPTPARIENLVTEISKKKLDDNQFDECDITIEELKTICDSLVKSLNAMYHARVQYPEQSAGKA
jgi:putative nucleotidyltransferase with HDIG domain